MISPTKRQLQKTTQIYIMSSASLFSSRDPTKKGKSHKRPQTTSQLGSVLWQEYWKVKFSCTNAKVEKKEKKNLNFPFNFCSACTQLPSRPKVYIMYTTLSWSKNFIIRHSSTGRPLVPPGDISGTATRDRAKDRVVSIIVTVIVVVIGESLFSPTGAR